MRFDRLGVFPYSPEEGTAAARMKQQIPGLVKNMRRNQIMKLQQGIAFERAAEMIGKTVDVLIEGKLPEDGVFVLRKIYTHARLRVFNSRESDQPPLYAAPNP